MEKVGEQGKQRSCGEIGPTAELSAPKENRFPNIAEEDQENPRDVGSVQSKRKEKWSLQAFLRRRDREINEETLKESKAWFGEYRANGYEGRGRLRGDQPNHRFC